MVRDRQERLDRYLASYGEGWLWWEPPLNVHPDSIPRSKPSAALFREVIWSGLGPYYVKEGIWKRSDYVHRLLQTSDMIPSHLEPYFERHPEDASRVNCQAPGPRLEFTTLLDSGATFPSLHTEDLQALGIQMNAYGAQSVIRLVTAGGDRMTRVFELFVSVLDNQGRQLVDSAKPVYPNAPHYLGSMCPVTECPVPLRMDEQGFVQDQRLSGMLPFLACYVATCPTRDFLFLGEDRNDVLGSHRMPGQKKWMLEMPFIDPGFPFNRYDNPKIQFVHRSGMIVDRDLENEDGASEILFLKGTPDETLVVSNPKNKNLAREPTQEEIGSDPTLAAFLNVQAAHADLQAQVRAPAS